MAKGFSQTLGVDYNETFSPIIKSSTIKVVLSMAVMQRWVIRQVDVNNTFFNGFPEEDVYITQPEGFIDS